MLGHCFENKCLAVRRKTECDYLLKTFQFEYFTSDCGWADKYFHSRSILQKHLCIYIIV